AGAGVLAVQLALLLCLAHEELIAVALAVIGATVVERDTGQAVAHLGALRERERGDAERGQERGVNGGTAESSGFSVVHDDLHPGVLSKLVRALGPRAPRTRSTDT